MGLPEDEVRARVMTALAVVGTADLEHRSAHHLSFGQKKRVATATVLSMRPSLWAFDEPTANLDPASRQAVEAFIAGCKDTVLVVTQACCLRRRSANAWWSCIKGASFSTGRSKRPCAEPKD
jgi:cobalt/nickel transport system ATP-binding protein